MKDLPQWVKKILDNENLTCGVCDRVVSLKDLSSMGIQKSSVKPHRETLFIGIICKSCKEMTLFELKEMTLLDFAFEILAEQSKEQSKEQSRAQTKNNRKELKKETNIPLKKEKFKKAKSKITLKEIKKSVSFLNSLETHDDFLIALGMSIEQIESYKLKKNERKTE